MRITNHMLYFNWLSQLRHINQDLLRFSEQVASQQRINRPSDDPQGTKELMILQQEMITVTGYNENTIEAQKRLEAVDSKLNSYTLALTRVVELVNQAVNSPHVGPPRVGIAQEIKAIQEQLNSLASSQIADRYIFAGARTTRSSIPSTPAGIVFSVADTLNVSGAGVTGGTVADRSQLTEHIYVIRFTDSAGSYDVLDLESDGTVTSGTVAVGAGTISFDGLDIDYNLGALPAAGEEWIVKPQYVYNGTEDELELQVDENTAVVQNVTGSEAFGGAGGVPGNTIFDDLVDLRYSLLTNDEGEIQAALDTFNVRLDDLLRLRTTVGGRLSNLRTYEEQGRARATDLIIRQAEVTGVDLPEAISKLTQTEGGLQVALMVGARLGQFNLFNFLS